VNTRTIVPADAEWPVLLNELGPQRPPERLFVAGLPLALDQPSVAVVGARRPTIAGLDAAERMARGLAEAGFAVVSGLAVGIDSVAHRAALRAGGHTIAVLGCGLDVNYPERNSGLKAQIAARGTLVTEYAAGTPPLAHHFPERNRIIAGLAAGVVYVEGGEKSGGRITARLALDANRSVFAVPGSVRNPLAAGPNELIRTCQATLVTDVRHVCEELAPGLVWTEPADVGPARRPVDLEESEAQVLCFLDDVPIAPDRICSQLGLSAGRVSLAAARLEVRGLIVRRPQGYEISSAGCRARDAYIAAHS
jgi:DNA processing protein